MFRRAIPYLVGCSTIVALLLLLGEPAFAQDSCSKGYDLNGKKFNTCTAAGGTIDCKQNDLITVDVSMTGFGAVTGVCECDRVASCTAGATIIPDDTCTQTVTATGPDTLKVRYHTFKSLGRKPTSVTVTCTVTPSGT